MTNPAAPARPEAAPAPLPVRTRRQRPGPATRSHALMLDPDDKAPRYARAAARASLGFWDLRHLTDDAQAITSELTANAAAASRAAATPGTDPANITLWLTVQDGELLIRVWDPDPEPPPGPPEPEPDPDDESGRGLMIVGALAAWWDWAPPPTAASSSAPPSPPAPRPTAPPPSPT